MSTKQEKLSWEEIKQQYPDQWVSLINIEHNLANGEIKSGVVLGADPDLKKLAQQAKEKEIFTTHSFRYTGVIRNFLGFSEWILEDVSSAHS